jgi:sugar O-acyltransferase (sialic acid O-acetyltransferase NeuD family)
VGSGGHARSCIDVIEQDATFSIYGLTGTADDLGCEVLGYPVLGTDNELGKLRELCESALVTVGQIETPDLRKKLFSMLSELGFLMPTVIAPTAHVSSNAKVGRGSIVMHGAVVNAGACVGENCIINSMSLIEHDAIVSDHCHISTGAIVNGGALVGDGGFLGSGCLIREGIEIGRQSVVGMGVVVRHNLPDDSLITRDQ